MPSSDNINNMPDRRHKSIMSDDQRKEFERLNKAISECSKVMGREVGNAQKGYEILVSKIEKATGNGDRRLKEHDDRIDSNDKALIKQALEIEKLKQADDIRQREILKFREDLDGAIKIINQVDHVGRHNSLALSSVQTLASSIQSSQTDSFTALSRQISTFGDSVNQLRNELLSKRSAQKWYAKLPLPAYGVITVAALGVVIYFLTGDDTIVNLFKRGG